MYIQIFKILACLPCKENMMRCCLVASPTTGCLKYTDSNALANVTELLIGRCHEYVTVYPAYNYAKSTALCNFTFHWLTRDFMQLASGFMQLAKGFMQVASGFMQLARDFMQLASGFMQLARGFMQLASSFVQLARGFMQLASWKEV